MQEESKYIFELTSEEVLESIKKKAPEAKGFFLGIYYENAVRVMYDGELSDIGSHLLMKYLPSLMDNDFLMEEIHKMFKSNNGEK